MSTKAEILQAWRFKEQTVSINGVSVLVREFSAAAREAFEASVIKIVDGKRVPDLDGMVAKLVALCAIDPETGTPMFTVDELSAAPASFIDPLFKAAQALNGMGEPQVEAAEKNSEAAPSGNT